MRTLQGRLAPIVLVALVALSHNESAALFLPMPARVRTPFAVVSPRGDVRGSGGRSRVSGRVGAGANSRTSDARVDEFRRRGEEVLRLREQLIKSEVEQQKMLKKISELEATLQMLTDGNVNREEITIIGSLKKITRSFEKSVKLAQRRADAWANSEPGGQLAYAIEETGAGARILADLYRSGALFDRVLPAAVNSPLLFSHTVALYARAAELEKYVPEFVPIIERHLPSIEPHLEEILDQWEKIEPHLEYIIKNIDKLAPHCGPLVKHIDELLLYADESQTHSRYFPELLDYIGYFAPRLDKLADMKHLTYLRPHLPKITPYIMQLAPNVDRFMAYPTVSANADVLVWYFGWALRTPVVKWVVQLWFRIPGAPMFCGWLATHLPKRPVRGQCAGIKCFTDDDFPTVSFRRAVRRKAGQTARLWRRTRRRFIP